MRSKYRGGCCVCQKRYEPGEKIVYYGKDRGIYCFDCWPAEDAPVNWREFDDPGYLFIDLETGGKNPEEGTDDQGNLGPCGMVQIAAIATTKHLVIQDWFSTLVRPNPLCVYEPEAMAIHGRTPESLMNEPEEYDALMALSDFCRNYHGYRVAGFNYQYDERVLRAARRRQGIVDEVYKLPALCVYEIAVQELLDENMKERFGGTRLVDVSTYHGYKIEGAHDALVDLYLTILNARRFIPVKMIA